MLTLSVIKYPVKYWFLQAALVDALVVKDRKRIRQYCSSSNQGDSRFYYQTRKKALFDSHFATAMLVRLRYEIHRPFHKASSLSLIHI